MNRLEQLRKIQQELLVVFTKNIYYEDAFAKYCVSYE